MSGLHIPMQLLLSQAQAWIAGARLVGGEAWPLNTRLPKYEVKPSWSNIKVSLLRSAPEHTATRPWHRAWAC